MAEASLLPVFQGTANAEAAKKWFDRLVWAELPVGDAKLWWPALRFESVAEFDLEFELEAAGNLDYRLDLAVCLMEKMLSEGNGPVQVVRFLGRPLADVQPVHQDDVLDFLGHINTRPGVFNPEHFVAQLGFDRARPLFEDFHRGMDDFAKILYQVNPRPQNFVPWATKAQRVWEAYLATRSQQMPLHQDPAAAPAHFPPQPPSLGQAPSPNHSVAAVSVADDSIVSVNGHHRIHPSNSTATKLSSNTVSGQRADKVPQQLDYDRLPNMDHLGMITWKEARVRLTLAGWTKIKNSETELYQPYPKGPHLNLEETKNVCQQVYGWKPLSEEATRTPRPPRIPHRHHEPPASNAKNYSFGFLWKHHCAPNNWTRSKKGAATSTDYYYFRPGFSRQNWGVKDEDHFEDHYGVVDWCQRNNYFPSSDWNSADDLSVATEVADDPSAYLDDLVTTERNFAKANKTKKKKQTPRNYSFGVLWASHLEPNGWTMPKAKRNPLTDYYYVRPGCTIEGGKLGLDYFATTDAVLEYCAKHHDYPESSGASTCSHDDRTVGTATMANEETSDDESTKIPAETEDEAIKPIVEEDDHTLGEFSTPGTKTQPQDPGKPLLRDDDETPEIDEEETYYWKNLWPVLEKQRGWTYMRARNEFDDWWYVLPRKLNWDGAKAEMVKGVHYFTTQQEVIDYCKRVDRDDTRVRLKTTKDGDRKQKKSVNSEEKIQQLKSKDSKASREKKNGDDAKKKTSDHSDQKIQQQSLSKDPKASQEKKTIPKMRKKRVQEPATAKDICVIVENDENADAPWVHSPLPRNLHNIVTTVGGITYSGSCYYLHDECPKKFSHRFQDIPELLKYLCSLGRGNYFLNPKAKTEDIKKYTRLIDYAFVTGSIFDHRRIRPLNRDEIILCLKDIFQFSLTDGEWQVPQFLRTKPEAELQEIPTSLKPSYRSLPELLQALRGIEHLEGDSGGRRRKPLDKKSINEQRDYLIMAFRLSIAEDTVVNGLHNIVKPDADEVKAHEKKKIKKTKNDGKLANGGHSPGSDVSTSSMAKNKKRGSPGSASKKGSKKLKPDRKFEIDDLKVKWKGDQLNPSPWVSMPCRDFTSAQRIGVSYQGGHYYLPDESFKKYTARFSSIDEVFTHLCTYGNYNLLHLGKDAKLTLKKHIALGNVPGLASCWNKYRLLDNDDAIAILGLLGFEELPDKSWLVPDILLQVKNPFRTGNPSLINPKYPSLDELRVALRSLPDLEMTDDGGRRRRHESKLNEHQKIAFRLWLASGPEGPDDTRMHDKTDDPPSNDELDASRTIEAMTPSVSNNDDNLNCQDEPKNDQLENVEFGSPEDSFQSTESCKMKVLDCPVEARGERNVAEVAPVTESQAASLVPCASDFASNLSPAIHSIHGVQDYSAIKQTEPQGGALDFYMTESEPEPTNESVSLLRTFVNPLKPGNADTQGGFKSACSLDGDTEMAEADCRLSKSTDENVCPNTHEVCTGSTGRELLTQPRGDSIIQESDDDENATFFNLGGRFEVMTSPTSPAETKVTEDFRKVYSVEQEGTWDRNQGNWLTQPFDD